MTDGLPFQTVVYLQKYGIIMDFVHLHNHSDNSILDGAITLSDMVARAVEMGMPAIALTDHGNMFGAIEFYQKAMKAGIKPIIGQEFYVAPGSRFKKESAKDNREETAYHLIVLAKNLTGYRNLMKLSSMGYTEGFYYKPRIDMEILEKYSDGLIISSACIAGQIPVQILKGRLKEARELAGRFSEIAGKGNFFLELQYHGIKEQETANAELIRISSEMDIPLIATNDAHYVRREDSYAHEVLLCVQTGKTMSDANRMKFSTNEFYLKSLDEMRMIFADYPDALFNTCKIAEMIDVELDLGNPILPNFEVPQGYNLDSYLRHLVDEGAARIYGPVLPDAVKARMEYELSVITSMKFSGYFLIVWDFINYARRTGVPVGPGRGSAAGSIISYCLGITALDPLRYNLLFERFLNPDRNEMPDMDIDFCADRREEVIDYVKRKYGEDHVSQIVTINRMKAKAVVKDVARALDIPFAEANEISKHIDGDSLKKSIDKSPELKKIYQTDKGRELLDISLKLEGLTRSAGKHAAGVVISKGPLTDYVPLYRDKDGSISSQYEKNTLEQAGLVKMDFLGLKNLSIIEKCLALVKATTGDVVDINNIPLDDSETYRLLQKADTRGVFQLESGGMQNIIRRLGPTEFEDIIAIVALYRPGPLGSGMVDDFIERKKNPQLVKYPHPALEPVLKDTLGVVVYQEQVMLISQIIAGFTLPEADKLRKAMGKKKMDIIDALEEKFISGAEKGGFEASLAEDLYSMIKKFGEYGFNKSHSAAYALVTYQTAYLKAHYRIQYMTALLSAQPDRQEDVIQYITDCRENGIKVLPPSINGSFYDFTIEGDAIRFGFGAIKGLGEKAIENIAAARVKTGGFKTLKQFLEEVDLSLVNKGVLEALIKSGSFDAIHKNRAQLYESMDLIIELARKYHQDIESGQGDLFSMQEGRDNTRIASDLPAVAEWKDNVKLTFEKEVIGLYLSGHPLSRFEKEIRSFPSYRLSEICEEQDCQDISIIGMLNNVTVRRSQKNGSQYAAGTLEDLDGVIEVIFFSRVLEKFADLINSTEPVMATGKIELDAGKPKKMIVNSLKSIKEVRRAAVSAIHIKIDSTGVDDNIIGRIRDVVEKHRGGCPLYFHVREMADTKIIRAHTSFNVQPSEEFIFEISGLVGNDSVRYSFNRYD
ncbi:MAG TPA: DNA polymerase III subunit alpha [Spirochaetota bacterium]|nr:DNA polymerase III subunit alpha [Spirochaetota bacterium]HQO39039.1 DNA polymerase III subunit alpha [Spirochaetota bacterium]